VARVHKRRMFVICVFISGAVLIMSLVLYALRQNINLFYTPQQLRLAKIGLSTRVRVGGLVVPGSIQQQAGLTVRFKITDYTEDLELEYTGILPDLFREGQGVVALGSLAADNIFKAQQILAKHDENYMPPELVNGLKDVT